MYTHRSILVFGSALLLAVAWVALAEPGADDEPQAEQGYAAEPAKTMPAPDLTPGIEVELQVYSGRPNPRWQLTEGAEYEAVLERVRGLEVGAEAPFDYDEWNQPGYASFWVRLRGVEDAPRSVHLWRDMAYLPGDVDDAGSYALGAGELYDLLVSQAESRDQGHFFANYREERQDREDQ